MNGEVIGTMEDSTELSHTDSPESSLKHDINDEDDPSLHKLSCTDLETANHVDEACEATDEPDRIAKVVSNGIANHKPDVTDEFLPQQENISNTAETHNSTTSNEPCLDSAKSEEKSEIEGEGSYETNLKDACNDTSLRVERTNSNNEVNLFSYLILVLVYPGDTIGIKVIPCLHA